MPCAELEKDFRIGLEAVGHHRAGCAFDQMFEVVTAFAGTEVNAEFAAIDACIEQPGIEQRLFGSAEGKLGIQSAFFPACGIGNVLGQVKVLHLGGERGRERTSIEVLDRPNAAAPFDLAVKEIGDGVS